MHSTFLPNLDKTTYLSSPTSSTSIIGSPIVDFGTVMTPLKSFPNGEGGSGINPMKLSMVSYVLPTVIVLVGGYMILCNPRR